MNDKNTKNIITDYTYNGKSLTFTKPLIMAIVNLTPDSFYDGGKFDTLKDVLKDVEEKLKQGADIIDIGAASSRPNSIEVSEGEEWQRLQNNISAIRKEFQNTFISVDTFRSSIAKKCADYGADIINDISGGNFDANMFKTVSEIGIPYILMHIQGTPQTMQQHPNYINVVDEVKAELMDKIKILKLLKFNKVIVDVGFGFGKTTKHNYQLLKQLQQFKDLDFPILAGLSRKSMINKVINTNPVTALNGTTVLNTIALLNGANILRVHDVAEAKQAINLVDYYNQV